MNDTIYRQQDYKGFTVEDVKTVAGEDAKQLKQLPFTQPTIYGYNLEHLELIARILQKEDLPPERVVEALTDIGRIVAIVRDDLVEKIKNGITVSNGNGDYFIGLRNGMRWCLSLIDEKEPIFETSIRS